MIHIMPELTVEQKANLRKLATFLNKRVPLPGFSMGSYFQSDAVFELMPDKLNNSSHYHECGAIACACGHGPLAGIPAQGGESWAAYANRAFGANNWESSVWNWCFSGSWASADNTPRGAAARIRYMLKRGIPPNYWDISRGYDPLPYKVRA